MSILRRIQRCERLVHSATTQRRKDGSIAPVSLTVSPIQGADGRTIGVSKIARDLPTGERRIIEIIPMNERG